jgi:hypothetical protein
MTSQTHADATDGTGCAECANGLRNQFFRGKQMKAEEFQTEQAYFIRRRRLVNRGVLGWGVVYGFSLDGPRPSAASRGHTEGAQRTPAPNTGAIKVGPGFALDQHGREIVLTQQALLGVDNVFALLPDSNGCSMQKIDKLAAGRYLLSIHYAERSLGDANLPDGCGCTKPQKRFVCETLLFSLEPLRGDCRCAEGDCQRECGCGVDNCCTAGRGPHSCLCQWVTKAIPAGEPARLSEWHGWKVDPGDGVALACVTVARTDDRCAPVVFTSIDDNCSPRRLVKNNDLLYDLIRGCDLTRIESISWATWHREPNPIPWHDFVMLMNARDEPPSGAKDVVTGLQIRFTGPVAADTLTPDCFSVRFTVANEDSGWRSVRAAPIVRVVKSAAEGTDPGNTTRSATLCVDPDWISEMRSRPSVFRYEGATVEIEVYGDYVLDCHGQAVDANARGFALARRTGLAEGTSGNGNPGGTFRSVFRIDRYAPPHEGGHHQQQRREGHES